MPPKKDMRLKANRIPGFNKDGSRDMRYNINKQSVRSSISRAPSHSTIGSHSMGCSVHKNVFTCPVRDYAAEERMRREREDRERRQREERERQERQRQEIERIRREGEERARREREERGRNVQETMKNSAKNDAITRIRPTLDSNVANAFKEKARMLMTNSAIKKCVKEVLLRLGAEQCVKDVAMEKAHELAKGAAEGLQHFNVVVIGKTGVGKSMLLNATLKLEGEQAETGGGVL